jgi:hypothetical protein
MRSWLVSRFYIGIYLKELEKTTKISVKSAGLRAKIRNWDLPKTKQVWETQSTATFGYLNRRQEKPDT